jgi:predicted transposase YbfD/YdcC
VESGNEYVLQVKGNQPKLLKAIKETLRNSRAVDIDYSLEKNRGRDEHREVHVFEVGDNQIYNDWYMASYIIHVVSKGKRKGRNYKENRYYLTNKKMICAYQYNIGIRNHWGIENLLHWVKDVIMNEDGGLVRNMKRCRTLSVFRNIVMNLFRVTGNKSIKYAIEQFTNCIDDCLKLIHGNNYILNI